MGKKIDLTGNRYGKLVVIKQQGLTKDNKALWLCQCDCGNTTTRISSLITNGHTKSCGCYRAEYTIKKNIKHGHAYGGNHSTEFNTWQNIKNRCLNPKNSHYKYYGGKGIKVCERWLNSFENFLADMGNKPSDNHSIERIENDKDYELSNCKWILLKNQQKNKTNSKILVHGERKLIQEDWAKILKCTGAQIKYFLDKGKTMAFIINHFKYEKRKSRNIDRCL